MKGYGLPLPQTFHCLAIHLNIQNHSTMNNNHLNSIGGFGIRMTAITIRIRNTTPMPRNRKSMSAPSKRLHLEVFFPFLDRNRNFSVGLRNQYHTCKPTKDNHHSPWQPPQGCNEVVTCLRQVHEVWSEPPVERPFVHRASQVPPRPCRG